MYPTKAYARYYMRLLQKNRAHTLTQYAPYRDKRYLIHKRQCSRHRRRHTRRR